MAKNPLLWDSLLQLTGQLLEGKSVLEDLVAESPKKKKKIHAALDRGFSNKRKRSPRNHMNQEPGVGLEKKKKSGFDEKNQNPKRRRRRCFEELGESSSTKRAKESLVLMDRHTIIHNNNNIQTSCLPAVPEAIKRRIIETGGRLESAACVIEKALFRTDLDSTKSRLSVPLRQVRDRFLFPGDKDRLLSDGGIRTTLVLPSPCFEEYGVLLGLWESNSTYVLNNGWNEVLEGNKTDLREGMVIRLWAFRRKSDDGLCFALELL